MDYLFLPYLEPKNEITQALKRMKGTDSRAIVCEDAFQDRRLYMNKTVVEASSKGKSLCSDLPQTEGTMLTDLGATPTVQWPPPFHPHGTWRSLEEFYEQQLDSQNSLYGILLPRPGTAYPMALVVTRHEPDADKIRNADKYCRCNEPQKHTSAIPPASEGGPCDWCNGIYECY